MKRLQCVALVIAILNVPMCSRPPTVSEPGVVRAVAPDFPAIAVQARAKGSVVVVATVGPAGEVVDAKLGTVRGPSAIYNQGFYERLVKQWRFTASEPSVELRTVDVEFVFRLMPRGTPPEQLGTIFLPPFKVEIREEHPQDVSVSDR